MRENANAMGSLTAATIKGSIAMDRVVADATKDCRLSWTSMPLFAIHMSTRRPRMTKCEARTWCMDGLCKCKFNLWTSQSRE